MCVDSLQLASCRLTQDEYHRKDPAVPFPFLAQSAFANTLLIVDDNTKVYEGGFDQQDVDRKTGDSRRRLYESRVLRVHTTEVDDELDAPSVPSSSPLRTKMDFLGRVHTEFFKAVDFVVNHLKRAERKPAGRKAQLDSVTADAGWKLRHGMIWSFDAVHWMLGDKHPEVKGVIPRFKRALQLYMSTPDIVFDTILRGIQSSSEEHLGRLAWVAVNVEQIKRFLESEDQGAPRPHANLPEPVSPPVTPTIHEHYEQRRSHGSAPVLGPVPFGIPHSQPPPTLSAYPSGTRKNASHETRQAGSAALSSASTIPVYHSTTAAHGETTSTRTSTPTSERPRSVPSPRTRNQLDARPAVPPKRPRDDGSLAESKQFKRPGRDRRVHSPSGVGAAPLAAGVQSAVVSHQPSSGSVHQVHVPERYGRPGGGARGSITGRKSRSRSPVRSSHSTGPRDHIIQTRPASTARKRSRSREDRQAAVSHGHDRSGAAGRLDLPIVTRSPRGQPRRRD